MPQMLERQPWRRSGLSASRWLLVWQRIDWSSQSRTLSRRHIFSLCGTSARIRSAPINICWSRQTSTLSRGAGRSQVTCRSWAAWCFRAYAVQGAWCQARMCLKHMVAEVNSRLIVTVARAGVVTVKRALCPVIIGVGSVRAGPDAAYVRN